jgi:hypothetical protein
LNVLTARERALLAGLTTDSAWQGAVAALAAEAASLVEVPADSTGFDSLALTAGDAQGTGYVTLAFGNSTNLSAPSEPISLSVIRVTCPLYRGELKVIESSNPLAEQLTLRHSGDFAGQPETSSSSGARCRRSTDCPRHFRPNSGAGFRPTRQRPWRHGPHPFRSRSLHTERQLFYRALPPRQRTQSLRSGVQPVDRPMLAEGWIKRVLSGIGPFEQRIKEYQDSQVNTIVSMISQAGARAVGDVALNLGAVDQAGLIEVYETVLRRGMQLSIEGAPPVDYPPANDALLLAAGRLADLYMLLGNEAYADAADPTIAFGTDHGVYGRRRRVSTVS